ncbi:MAG: hypothetical protein ACKVPZ_05785 [Burkholderiaceae bacterium]
MNEDKRCCGTGTCIIDAEGLCWCGQKWNGHSMSFATPDHSPPPSSPSVPHKTLQSEPTDSRQAFNDSTNSRQTKVNGSESHR